MNSGDAVEEANRRAQEELEESLNSENLSFFAAPVDPHPRLWAMAFTWLECWRREERLRGYTACIEESPWGAKHVFKLYDCGALVAVGAGDELVFAIRKAHEIAMTKTREQVFDEHLERREKRRSEDRSL